MTHPSYYDDSLAHTFSTTVAAVEAEGTTIILSETLFYPEGGGQPADIGVIAGAPVKDVQKDEAGTIRHYLEERPQVPLEPGVAVTGEVDWKHRWDFMQQHTGQHILSASLAQVADAPTVSVHQGSELTTIEVERETITSSLLDAVEARANEIIRADLSVRGFWIDDSELSDYRLRRPTKRRGAIRLVEIDGVDLVACGGVHLPRTGLVNLIHLSTVERIRGRTRLGFKIGDRALDDYRDKDRTLKGVAERFSCQPSDVPARVSGLVEELQELHRARRDQARRIAELLYAEAGSTDKPVLDVRLTDEDPEVFSALAELAAERITTDRPTDDGERSRPTAVGVQNLTNDGLHWAIVIGIQPFPQQQLRSELLEPLGAKGGGKPPLWRGIIKEADSRTGEEFHRRFQHLLRNI
jgi:alanyl-tRNA synthetase